MSENKKDVVKKWAPIFENLGITGDKADWLSEYAEYHSNGENKCEASANMNVSMFPVCIKIASKTLSLDLVSVKPIPSPFSNMEGMKEIEAEVKAENRSRKIDSIIKGEKFNEMKIEQHPKYKNGLVYIDFKYGDNI